MRLLTEFHAAGVPQSKGSMVAAPSWRAIINKQMNIFGWKQTTLRKCNIPLLASNQKTLKPWMTNVSTRMQAAYTSGPIKASFVLTGAFYMPRPAQHYSLRHGEKYRDGDGYVIKERFKRVNPNTKPDVDKLIRAILDSGEGIIWQNDSQVININMPKRYANGQAGVICKVWVLDEQELPPEPEQLELF